MNNIKDIKQLFIAEFYTKNVGKKNHGLLSEDLNPQVRNIILKAERIYFALIIISKQINKDERLTFLELVRGFYSQLLDKYIAGGSVSLDAINSSMLKIMSFLDELYVMDILSLQNVEVLKNALLDLYNLLKNTKHITSASQGILSAEDFVVALSSGDLNEEESADNDPVEEAESVKDIKDIKDKTTEDSKGHKGHKGHENPESSINTGKEEVKPKRPMTFADQKSVRMRRMQIVNALESSSKPLTGAEIAKNVKGEWSSKTIQRELNQMLKDGILMKDGERRWARYMLRV